MLEGQIYKYLVFSRIRQSLWDWSFQGIHVVMELGYLESNFIFVSSKILVYTITSSLPSLTCIYTMLLVFIEYLLWADPGAVQATEVEALRIDVLSFQYPMGLRESTIFGQYNGLYKYCNRSINRCYESTQEGKLQSSPKEVVPLWMSEWMSERTREVGGWGEKKEEERKGMGILGEYKDTDSWESCHHRPPSAHYLVFKAFTFPPSFLILHIIIVELILPTKTYLASDLL